MIIDVYNIYFKDIHVQICGLDRWVDLDMFKMLLKATKMFTETLLLQNSVKILNAKRPTTSFLTHILLLTIQLSIYLWALHWELQ